MKTADPESDNGVLGLTAFLLLAGLAAEAEGRIALPEAVPVEPDAQPRVMASG
jgi:hypothetical protein